MLSLYQLTRHYYYYCSTERGILVHQRLNLKQLKWNTIFCYFVILCQIFEFEKILNTVIYIIRIPTSGNVTGVLSLHMLYIKKHFIIRWKCFPLSMLMRYCELSSLVFHHSKFYTRDCNDTRDQNFSSKIEIITNTCI